MMVGDTRIELVTSSVSRKRSPTELTAHAAFGANRQSIAKGPAAVKRFCLDGAGPCIACPSTRLRVTRLAYWRIEKSGINSRFQALFIIIAVAA